MLWIVKYILYSQTDVINSLSAPSLTLSFIHFLQLKACEDLGVCVGTAVSILPTHARINTQSRNILKTAADIVCHYTDQHQNQV